MGIGKEFICGGKAIFTVSAPTPFVESHQDCRDHYTFRVVRREASNGWNETYFVSLLCGPDNTGDYGYLGVLDPTFGKIRLTAKSLWTDDSWPVRILRRVLARVWAGEQDQIALAGWTFAHAGRCGRCGRLLTVPESIENGFGPDCVKEMAF